MERHELVAWLNHHKVVFPGFGRWLDGLEAEGKTAAILDHWHRVLRDIPLDLAKESSDDLYTSTAAPRVYENHVAAVRTAARDKLTALERARFGRTDLARCQHCHDAGLVSIWCMSSPALAGIYSDRLGPAASRVTVAVPCSCATGFARFPGRRERYDADQHVRADGPYSLLPPETRQMLEMVHFS